MPMPMLMNHLASKAKELLLTSGSNVSYVCTSFVHGNSYPQQKINVLPCLDKGSKRALTNSLTF